VLVPLCVDLFAEYTAVRTNIALPRSGLAPIDAPVGTQPCASFGVHSALSEVTRLYKAGDAAFIANIGPLVEPVTKQGYYDGTAVLPRSLFSHNSQTRSTQTVVAQDMSADGVLGRALDSLKAQSSAWSVGAYSIAGNARMLRGLMVPDVIDQNDGIVRYSAYNRLSGYIDNMTKHASGSALGETYSVELQEMLVRSEVLGDALDGIELDTTFPTSSIGKQLSQVAKLIKTHAAVGTEREVYFVSTGGWDMHNEVTNALEARLGEVNSALVSFVAEMGEQDVWDDVVLVANSEFSRTITSNGRGTDHGWGGNHYIIGGAVKGGQIFGHYPSQLTEDSPQILSRGRAIPETPLEGIWSPVLEWFGVEPDDLDDVLPNRRNFPSSALIPPGDLFEDFTPLPAGVGAMSASQVSTARTGPVATGAIDGGSRDETRPLPVRVLVMGTAAAVISVLLVSALLVLGKMRLGLRRLQPTKKTVLRSEYGVRGPHVQPHGVEILRINSP